MRRVAYFSLALALLACGGDAEDENAGGGGAGASGGAGGAGGGECVAGERLLEDGTCLAAGVQSNGCPAGESLVDGVGCVAAGDPGNGCAAGELAVDGGCAPAGVTTCEAGFASDGDAGCEPVLPAAPCSAGQIATLGETACRDVAPCAAGTWGDIPTDADTMFVDGTATGPQDGSMLNPYRTIQAGVDGALPNAIVAIAAGTYGEDVVISGKAVRLWGKCPGEVEIAGTTTAITIGAAADGTELRDLAVTSDDVGVDVTGSTATVERIWVHDTGGYGFQTFDAPPNVTSVTLRSSLFENTSEQGVYISGSDAVLEELVIVDTASVFVNGWGLTVLEDETTFKRSTASIDNVVVERAAGVGVLVHASDVVATSIYVSDTQPNAMGRFGRGFVGQAVSSSTGPADLTVRGLHVDGARDAGILLAYTTALVENAVVRNVGANLDLGERGNGLGVQHEPIGGNRSDVTLRTSLIEGTTEHGVHMGNSDLLLEGVLVRNISPRPADDSFGRGIALQTEANGSRGAATVRGCVVTNTVDMGIFIEGVDAVIENTVVTDTAASGGSNNTGFGIGAQDDPGSSERGDLTLVGSVLTRNHLAGLYVAGSDAHVERTLVTATQPLDTGLFGRGMNFQDNDVTGQSTTVTVLGCRLEDNHEVSVMAAGVEATFEGVLVVNTLTSPFAIGSARGFNLQTNVASGVPTTAIVRSCELRGSTAEAIFIGGANVTVESTRVTATRPNASGLFGDGIVAMNFVGETNVTLSSSVIADNERAGISGFGAVLEIDNCAVTCNALDLAGEMYLETDAMFDDRGGNLCGCGNEETCKVLSASLEAPAPLPEVED